MFDVTALGELLIDFTENGVSENGDIMLYSMVKTHGHILNSER